MKYGTYKFMKRNCYGFNPANSEYITDSITGDELSSLGVTLEITTGHINGCVDEYDRESIIRDTIRVMFHDELLGFIRINSDELQIPLKYDYEVSDFTYITFASYNTKGNEEYADLKQAIIEQLPYYYCTTGTGLQIRSFLTIHNSDLKHSKTIILNKLKELIGNALANTIKERNKYIHSIKEQYLQYM